MTDTMEWPPPYTVRRYRLARHVKLRASRADGLIISTPQRFSLKHIPGILEEHRDWIIARLSELQVVKPDELPTSIELPAVRQYWKVEYIAGTGRTKLFQSQHHQAALKRILSVFF